jgi:hypothetical protein
MRELTQLSLWEVTMLTIVVIIVVIVLLTGGGVGYSRRGRRGA